MEYRAKFQSSFTLAKCFSSVGLFLFLNKFAYFILNQKPKLAANGKRRKRQKDKF